MLKKIIFLILACAMLIINAGCALIGTALSAAAAYGIYRATNK